MHVHPTQSDQLRSLWPLTYAAVRETYYSAPEFGQTRANGQNDAGYLLQGLSRYRALATDRHQHRDISLGALDAAAAREVRYQWGRGRLFDRPCAALSSCWCHLVVERPERIFAAAATVRRRETGGTK